MLQIHVALIKKLLNPVNRAWIRTDIRPQALFTVAGAI
jgi:hypothetical protein